MVCLLLLRYRFKVEYDAWNQYAKELDIDGDLVFKGNYPGAALGNFSELLLSKAPLEDEVREYRKLQGKSTEIRTVDATVKHLRREIRPFLE